MILIIINFLLLLNLLIHNIIFDIFNQLNNLTKRLIQKLVIFDLYFENLLNGEFIDQ
jgi:hypothetical protein